MENYLRINYNNEKIAFKVDLDKSLSENIKNEFKNTELLIGLLNKNELNLKHNVHGDIDLESKLSDFSNLVKEREDIINDGEVNYGLIDLELNYNGDKDILNAEIIANNSNTIKSLFSKDDESKIKNLYENIVKSYSNLVHRDAKEDFNLKLDGNKIEISKKIDAHIIENNGNFYAFDSTDIVMNLSYNGRNFNLNDWLKVSTEKYNHPTVWSHGKIDSIPNLMPKDLCHNLNINKEGVESLVATYLMNVEDFMYKEPIEKDYIPVDHIEDVGNKIATNFKDAVKYAKKNNIKTERIYRSL